MTDQEVNELLKRFEANSCTPEDELLLQQWFLHSVKAEELPVSVPDYAKVKATVLHNITGYPKIIRFTTYIRYAAAVIAIVGIGSILYFGTFRKFHSEKETKTFAEILPGGNSATLTLANGKEISLDSLNGKIATGPSGALVSNNSGSGVITYQLTNGKGQKGVRVKMYPDEVNTINIPKGGQYQLVLADGTRVFLNSDSKLQYPVNFTAGERKVFLSGEGYFQVAKDTKRPFIVTTQGQQVKVLGTQFNVNAYPNETTKTTLAEGSVELSSSSSLKKQLLKPDQQAILLSDGFQLRYVNAEDETAWKDGLFIFNQVAVADALRQISRWYNIQVDYSQMPNLTISAEISKKQRLSDVLNVLESVSGLKFTMKEGRLTTRK